ncbi:MAG TPA: TetR/AcrR family transcriptional regulator [Devosia sp.]|nr:TetR/AcrR family transcriptional regulator [Devosia sp.]
MARTIDPDGHDAKRNSILDAAHVLVLSKGYDRMSIGDILAQLQISSGAFYHYFDSKPAILDALVQRICEGSREPLQRVVDDPGLAAVDKLQAFLSTLDALRRSRQQTILELMRVWYDDHNAIVRQKVETAVRGMRLPMLAAIIEQGVREGAFVSRVADRSAEVVASLIEGMADHHAAAILGFPGHRDERRFTREVIAIHTAYIEAIERALGSPAGVLRRIGRRDVARWLAALTR